MATLDVINQRSGRGTLRSAAEGMEKSWQMKRQRLSPSYTTDWDGLPTDQDSAEYINCRWCFKASSTTSVSEWAYKTMNWPTMYSRSEGNPAWSANC